MPCKRTLHRARMRMLRGFGLYPPTRTSSLFGKTPTPTSPSCNRRRLSLPSFDEKVAHLPESFCAAWLLCACCLGWQRTSNQIGITGRVVGDPERSSRIPSHFPSPEL